MASAPGAAARPFLRHGTEVPWRCSREDGRALHSGVRNAEESGMPAPRAACRTVPIGRPLASCGLLLLLLAGACSGDPLGQGHVAAAPQVVAPRPPVTLTLGAFSAAREALETRVVPTFLRSWRRQHEQPVDILTRYGGSEELTRDILAGSHVDVAVFALTRDLEVLAQDGRVAPDWHERPHGGIVCRSVVVLAVRKGNPKGIRDWADLARPDVRVVTPDPARSGGGIWNACAVYGAALRGHAGVPAGDPAAARAFLQQVMANVVARAPNASESFRSFHDGEGDVAITYESEILLGWLFGHDEERVFPTSTLLVESPAARLLGTAPAAASNADAAAEALLGWLWSKEAQRQFASRGLRPVDPEVADGCREQFPEPPDLWTIGFLGNWEHIVGETRLPDLTAPPARPGK